MRKSTKYFLMIGSLPIILGLIGFVFGGIFYIIECTTEFCESVKVLPIFLLAGIPSMLVASICAGIYNFIYDRLYTRVTPINEPNTTSSELNTKPKLKHNLLVLCIMGIIAIVLWFAYSINQDNRTAKGHREWKEQQGICVKLVESQTGDSQKCTNENYTLNGVCTRVDINESRTESVWKSYYIDRDLYENCLKNPPALNAQ